MTVVELIEKLKEFPQDAQVYVTFSVEGDRCEPAPQYCDWGNPNDPDRGVYL